jgi:hypothetical protein
MFTLKRRKRDFASARDVPTKSSGWDTLSLAAADLAADYPSKSIRTVSKAVPKSRTAAAFAALEGACMSDEFQV